MRSILVREMSRMKKYFKVKLRSNISGRREDGSWAAADHELITVFELQLTLLIVLSLWNGKLSLHTHLARYSISFYCVSFLFFSEFYFSSAHLAYKYERYQIHSSAQCRLSVHPPLNRDISLVWCFPWLFHHLWCKNIRFPQNQSVGPGHNSVMKILPHHRVSLLLAVRPEKRSHQRRVQSSNQRRVQRRIVGTGSQELFKQTKEFTSLLPSQIVLWWAHFETGFGL